MRRRSTSIIATIRHRTNRLALPVMIVAMLVATAGSISAQQIQIDTAQSDQILTTLGLPEIAVTVGPDGVEAPDSLAAGRYLVTLSAAEPYVAYVDFMQPPAGLTPEEEHDLAKAAAGEDLAQHDWVYAGGNNTFEVGVPVRFVVELAAGEYQIAASYYTFEENSEEVMTLMPLTVTEGATPAASVAEPAAAVTLDESDDLRYTVNVDTVPSGPQVWKIANTGEMHAHHAVFWRIPEGITADDIVADFAGLMSGTPPAGPPLISRFVHVGYSALQSGGQTTWIELDLTPGTYAVICFIIDPMTGRPHVMDGMATVFTVQ
jgi:hypothetical protein